MGEGYLQLKIRENKEQIENISKKMFELENMINSLNRDKTNLETYIKSELSNSKDILNEMSNLDIGSIKNEVNQIVNDAMKVQTEKAINTFKSEILKQEIKVKNDFKDMKKEISNMLHDKLFVYFKEFYGIIGDSLFEIHDVLLKNKLIQQPITNKITYIKSKDSKEEWEFFITYAGKKAGADKGRNLSKKMIKRIQPSKGERGEYR